MNAEREIGLAIDTVGSYGREVIQGVMAFCHLNPHWVISVDPKLWLYDGELEPDTWDVDGLIIQVHNDDLADRVRRSGTPTINVANMDAPTQQIPTIVPDDRAVGKLAGDYLLSLGFKHFGFVAHGVYEFSKLRGDAYREVMAAAGHTIFEIDTKVDDLKNWLPSLPKPIALFCCNDAWAHRVLTAARRCQLRVPDQVAVLGVDDDELLNTVGSLPMSSIAIPASKIGFEAARMLEAALNGTPIPMHTTLPPISVVARATTKIANDQHPEVADALNFIRLNVSKALQVDDVADHLSISRRSLERRFQTALGRSVASEIRRAHVERAQQLLTNTGMSVEDIAIASGFANATMLGVHFRRYLNESPTAFRRRSSIGRLPNQRG